MLVEEIWRGDFFAVPGGSLSRSLSLSWSTNSIVGEAAVGGEVVDAVSVVRWRDRSFMLRMQPQQHRREVEVGSRRAWVRRYNRAVHVNLKICQGVRVENLRTRT